MVATHVCPLINTVPMEQREPNEAGLNLAESRQRKIGGQNIKLKRYKHNYDRKELLFSFC